MSYAKKLNDAACITTAGACVVHFENAQSIGEEADAEIAKLREELEEARKVIDLFAQVPPSERRTLAAICDSPHPDDAIYGYRYFGMMRAARAFLARKEAK